MKHADLAKHFIEQEKQRLRAGSMWFERNIASSYGTSIARIVTGDQPYVLILPAGWYSKSTSQHCNHIDGAARAAEIAVVRAPVIAPHNVRDHAENVAYMMEAIEQEEQRAKRSKYAEWYHRRVAAQQEMLTFYTDHVYPKQQEQAA